MKFSDIVKQALALLQDSGRVSYRVFKREFDLDNESLEDLKDAKAMLDELSYKP